MALEARYVCCCYLEAAHTTDASPDIRFWSEKTRERGKETPHIHANIKLESCFARQCCNCISYVKQKMHGKQPFQPKCVERYFKRKYFHPSLSCVWMWAEAQQQQEHGSSSFGCRNVISWIDESCCRVEEKLKGLLFHSTSMFRPFIGIAV